MSAYEDGLDELYDIPAVSFNMVATVEQEVIHPLAETEMMSREEEDELIKITCEKSAIEWQRQIDEANASWRSNRKRSHTWVRGEGSSCVGRTKQGGFVRFQNKVSSSIGMHPVSVPMLPVSVRMRPPPPQGYVCKRCKIPGHLIQHCPTNGDPDFDIIKKFKSPTGIPKERLIVSTDGSYTLPGGACAVFKPNEDAFDKQFEGIIPSSSTQQQRVIPAELHCPLCKKVMKDGVLASKCCFNSFCDKCIRDHLISNSLSCVCGAKNVLADSLLPNITLRNTINRYLQSGYSSSSSSVGSAISQVQDNGSSSKKRKLLHHQDRMIRAISMEEF